MLIPLKVDVPMRRRPWVNVAIIVVTIVVSIWAWVDESVLWAFAESSASVLVHVGPWHLIGNMVFLWVFGNAVNYKFGHVKYLSLYLLSALAGDFAHYTFSAGVAIGASGAIFGVMGAFLVFFTRNDVTVFWLIWIRPGVSRVSSGWIIALWVVWNVFDLAIGWASGVAICGHLGGFVAGFAIALLCAASGLIKPTEDEETLLQVLSGRR